MFSSQKAVHEIQLIEHDFVLSIEDAAGAFSKASNPPPPSQVPALNSKLLVSDV